MPFVPFPLLALVREAVRGAARVSGRGALTFLDSKAAFAVGAVDEAELLLLLILFADPVAAIFLCVPRTMAAAVVPGG